MESRLHGTEAHGLAVWSQPMVPLRMPMLFNLRSDPFERSQHEAGDYVKWSVERALVLLPAQKIVAQHLASYQQFPPRQRPGSFSIEQVMQKCGGVQVNAARWLGINRNTLHKKWEKYQQQDGRPGAEPADEGGPPARERPQDGPEG